MYDDQVSCEGVRHQQQGRFGKGRATLASNEGKIIAEATGRTDPGYSWGTPGVLAWRVGMQEKVGNKMRIIYHLATARKGLFCCCSSLLVFVRRGIAVRYTTAG